MLRLLTALLLVFIGVETSGQSYRGIAVVSDSVCWVSGSRGTVLRTANGGASWDTVSPAGYSTKEFRDIHAFNRDQVIVMSSGDSAVVLKTMNGGKTWNLVHSSNRPGVFYDAMDFHQNYGVIVGDPYMTGSVRKFDMIFSCDSGNNWCCDSMYWMNGLWTPAEGEALYAASGSNIFLRKRRNATATMPNTSQLAPIFISGGLTSMLYDRGMSLPLPFASCATCGAYGMALGLNEDKVIVGGDYLKPNVGEGSAVYYDGKTRGYGFSKTPPGGYRSGVAVSQDYTRWVCTGTNGSDVSMDNGKNWKPLALPGFNTLAFSRNYLWLAGDKGRVQRVAVSDLR